MRVLMYYSNSDVRVQEMDVPKPGPGELLVKVVASGICGSDVMEWYRRDKVPLVLGHEVAGEVVELGPGTDRFKVGDRVAVTHHVPCNTCRYCLNGNPTMCETLLKGTHFDPGGLPSISGFRPSTWTGGHSPCPTRSPTGPPRSWSPWPASCGASAGPG